MYVSRSPWHMWMSRLKLRAKLVKNHGSRNLHILFKYPPITWRQHANFFNWYVQVTWHIMLSVAFWKSQVRKCHLHQRKVRKKLIQCCKINGSVPSTYAQLIFRPLEARRTPWFENQKSSINLPRRQYWRPTFYASWHQQIDHFIRLQWPNHSNCVSQLVVSHFHFFGCGRINEIRWFEIIVVRCKWILPGLILMSKFSRINANSVVVKPTLKSSSIGIFMRMSFLYATRFGHLLPNPSGGSMFFSISNIFW